MSDNSGLYENIQNMRLIFDTIVNFQHEIVKILEYKRKKILYEKKNMATVTVRNYPKI